MPYGRLQYNWDNQYTTKDKRNLLLTQEVIEKINNIMPGDSIDAVVETDSHSLMTRAQLKELWSAVDIFFELSHSPFGYLYSLADEEVLYQVGTYATISEDWWESVWEDSDGYFLERNWYEWDLDNSGSLNGGGSIK